MHDMKHMDFIEDVSKNDVATLRRKEETYQGSWKKRGGVFAFAMVVRKWDRLDNILERQFGQDIFAGCLADTNGADGSVLAEVRDLRQYLLLVEAEIQSRIARGRPSVKDLVGENQPIPREDSNKHHSESAEFPMNDASRAVCSSYRSNYLNGRCMDCGHLKEAHIARAAVTEPDWDSKVGTKQGDGTWKVKPLISATLFRKLKDPDLISRFIVTGTYAQVDRRFFSEKERAELFRPLSATVSRSDFGRMADADKEFYEPRPGVEGEMQLKEMFREAWIA
jgi:hypothetical protein